MSSAEKKRRREIERLKALYARQAAAPALAPTESQPGAAASAPIIKTPARSGESRRLLLTIIVTLGLLFVLNYLVLKSSLGEILLKWLRL